MILIIAVRNSIIVIIIIQMVWDAIAVRVLQLGIFFLGRAFKGLVILICGVRNTISIIVLIQDVWDHVIVVIVI